VTVHKQYAAEVDAWLAAKNERCNIDCPPVGPPVCAQGRCVSPERQGAPPATAPPPGPTASTSGTGDDAVVVGYFAQKSWAVVRVERFARLPHVYRAVFADGAQVVRVRDGRVTDGKGLDAMAAYMRSEKVLAQPALSFDDVITLVDLFDAYASSYLGQGYYLGKEHKALAPSFAFHDGAGQLKLYYVLPHGGVEAVPNPNVIKVARATLEVSKDSAPAWKSETFDFDTKHP
jgi:hypothetical protein